MIAYKYREVIKTAVQPGAAVKVSRKVKYFLKKTSWNNNFERTAVLVFVPYTAPEPDFGHDCCKL